MNIYLYLMGGSIAALVGFLIFFSFIKGREEDEERDYKEEMKAVKKDIAKVEENVQEENEYLTKEDFSKFSHNMRVLMEDSAKILQNYNNSISTNTKVDAKDSGNYTVIFKNISGALTKISDDLDKLNSRLTRIEDKNESIEHQLLVLTIVRLKTTVPKGILGKQMAERISTKIGLTPDEVAEVLTEIKTKYTV